MKPAPFEYVAPRDIDSALRLAAQAESMGKYLAGSQSLGPMLNLRLLQPAVLIDLRRLEEMKEVSDLGDRIRLGAGTTHAAVEDGHVPDPSRGLLPYVARGIAYRPVRNRGTMGGSLAHADPAADWVTTLALIGATGIVRGTAGERRIPLDAFLSGPFTTALAEDDLLIAVEVPKLSSAARWGYYKVCRKAGEFAQAIGAVLTDPETGIDRAVIGATDGPPIVLDDPHASPGRDGLSEALSSVDEIKSRLLRVALERARQMSSQRAAA